MYNSFVNIRTYVIMSFIKNGIAYLQILDKLEYLRTMELTLIPAFLRLQELVSHSLN